MSGYLSARSFLLVCSLAVCLYSLSNHFFGENPVKNVHRRRGTQTAPAVAESGFFWDRPREQLSVPAAPLVSRKTEDFMAAKWVQKTVVLPAKSRGCHLVTDQVCWGCSFHSSQSRPFASWSCSPEARGCMQQWVRVANMMWWEDEDAVTLAGKHWPLDQCCLQEAVYHYSI
jgi:hypothetical protein